MTSTCAPGIAAYSLRSGSVYPYNDRGEWAAGFDRASYYAGWFECLVGDIVSKLTAMGHKLEPSGGGWFYEGRPVSDTEFDMVRVADRMLCAVARIPGTEHRGCDGCSRILSDVAVDWADGHLLAGFTSNDEVQFCPFCRLDYDEAAVHAPEFSDNHLLRLNTYRHPATTYQQTETANAIAAEIDRRGLTGACLGTGRRWETAHQGGAICPACGAHSTTITDTPPEPRKLHGFNGNVPTHTPEQP